MVKDENLTFRQIRELTPQWSVSLNDKEIAIVTKRIVQEPPYVVAIFKKEDKTFSNRDDVIEYILNYLNN